MRQKFATIISKGSLATHTFKTRNMMSFIACLMKEFKKSVKVCLSYERIPSCVFFLAHSIVKWVTDSSW